jgi:tripartite-type tricarboxylate transporter receptor subunit TctC
MRSPFKIAAGILALGLSFSQPAAAQSDAGAYPTKPIRMILSFPPGGSSDQIARLLAPILSERLGQQVFIDNRPGAGGNIAINAVAKAAPDGYTIGVGATGALGINSLLSTQTPYDPVKDLAPVGLMVTLPFVLVAHPSVKADTVTKLIAEGRSRPGSLSIGHGGNGTLMHLSSEMFKRMSQVDAVLVPYKGTGPATADAVGGQIPLTMSDVTTALPYVKAGRLKAIAVSSAQRSASMPDVPTFAEAGLPKYDATGWIAVVAPAGTPAAIIRRLNAELVAALKQPDVRARIIATGSDPAPTTPAELGQLLRSDMVKWGAVIKDAGIKSE